MLLGLLSNLDLSPSILLAAAAPPLANVVGIWLCKVTGYDKGTREEDAEKVYDVALALCGQFPGNVLLTLLYPDGEWSLLKVFLGMLVLDTIEYWVHRFLHAHKWLYRMTHQTHHMPPSCAALSLYNSACEVLPFSTCITISFYLSGVTWMDFIIVTSLANLKTAWDHASTRKGHHHELHHSKPCYNFEQPFFDVWDRLMGTRAWPEDIEKERLARAKVLAEKKAKAAAAGTSQKVAKDVKAPSMVKRVETPRAPTAS
jgi:sterol desaturase/sphingolipid hydroxylase (fatty acid hydroxylase superfamily)